MLGCIRRDGDDRCDHRVVRERIHPAEAIFPLRHKLGSDLICDRVKPDGLGSPGVPRLDLRCVIVKWYPAHSLEGSMPQVEEELPRLFDIFARARPVDVTAYVGVEIDLQDRVVGMARRCLGTETSIFPVS